MRAERLVVLARHVHSVAPMSGAWIMPLLGGAMIGAASALLLLTHGQVAGVSGILGSSLLPPRERPRDGQWRLAFLGGLCAAGLVGSMVAPAALGVPARSLPLAILAGLLVGFGSRLGGGCTSGHGICGVARLSTRSLVAVATFITTGALTAGLMGGAL
jgi:uncharacterized membrane protein YedE/YeeE